MNNLKKISYLSVCAFVFIGFVSSSAAAQERPRVARMVSSQPINQPPSASRTTAASDKTPSSNVLRSAASRPVLTNKIVVTEKPLVKKTGESSPVAALASLARRSVYSDNVSTTMMSGIRSRLGIPYLYGSEGPNRYDCSGFVWAVFKDAGIEFERTSARSLWSQSEPVTGDERYKFGTLVFMNGLGHMGIVADEKGFYHASSSKGVTYSTFEGYWEKRITGFRRLKVPTVVIPAKAADPAELAEAVK